MRRVFGGLAVLATLVACTPTDTPSPGPTPTLKPSASPTTVSPSPTPTEPSPSPSPTVVDSFPAAPSTETAEQAEVRAAWTEYYTQFARFAADSSLHDLTQLTNLVTNEELSPTLQQIQNLREAGERVAGGFRFRDVVVSVPHPEIGGDGSALVEYCFDRSGLDVRDETTDEPIARALSNYEEQATLTRSSEGVWLVDSIRNRESTC